jgi:hypothetical protein
MPAHSPDFAALPVASSKWSRTFWADLAERVGATAIGALLAVVAGSSTGAIPNDPAVWWSVIGVPTVVSLLKGLAANMADPTSGPSLLPSPPAPQVDEAGNADALVILAVAILIGVVLILFGVRLG